MTKSFEARAREWANKNHNVILDEWLDFARHLDQEAQEKPQQCEHGVDTDITVRKSYQPEQPYKTVRYGTEESFQQPEMCDEALYDEDGSLVGNCGRFKPCKDHEQPEKIEWVETNFDEYKTSQSLINAVNKNLIKIGKLLEASLTHKD